MKKREKTSFLPTSTRLKDNSDVLFSHLTQKIWKLTYDFDTWIWKQVKTETDVTSVNSCCCVCVSVLILLSIINMKIKNKSFPYLSDKQAHMQAAGLSRAVRVSAVAPLWPRHITLTPPCHHPHKTSPSTAWAEEFPRISHQLFILKHCMWFFWFSICIIILDLFIQWYDTIKQHFSWTVNCLWGGGDTVMIQNNLKLISFSRS